MNGTVLMLLAAAVGYYLWHKQTPAAPTAGTIGAPATGASSTLPVAAAPMPVMTQAPTTIAPSVLPSITSSNPIAAAPPAPAPVVVQVPTPIPTAPQPAAMSLQSVHTYLQSWGAAKGGLAPWNDWFAAAGSFIGPSSSDLQWPPDMPAYALNMPMQPLTVVWPYVVTWLQPMGLSGLRGMGWV